VHLTFKRLSESVSLPTAQHPGDAGYDLQAARDAVLGPGERALVPTGVAVAIPAGYAGLVVPRSGWAIKYGLSVVNAPGIVDAGYRGELQAILINHGSETIEIKTGERVAQLIIVAVPEVDWIEVDQLEESVRGEAGFGSTGR
jgi:dUTP pyrophosphatase